MRVFQTSDPSGTLSDPLSTGNDPSDLAFLADNTRLVVANSQSFNVTLVDTSDPSAPTVIDDFNTQGGVPYGTTYVPSRSWILAPTTQLSTGVPSALNIFEVEGDVLSTLSVETLPGGSFPLTAAVDAEGDFAFVAHVSDQQLSIIDLETLAIRSVSWLDDFGPTYAAVQP